MEIDKLLDDWCAGYHLNEQEKGQVIKKLFEKIKELENQNHSSSAIDSSEVIQGEVYLTASPTSKKEVK